MISAAVIIMAENWVSKKTTEILETRLSDISFQRDLVNRIDKSVIGASYQSHVILGGTNSSPEHYVPIYVSGYNEARLYLQIAHNGADVRRSVEIYLDQIPIPISAEEIVSRPQLQKEINLTSYIKKSKDLGIHDQDERIHTLRFRINPTEKTKNSVSIKALINIHGLLRTPTVIDERQGN